MRQFLFLLVIAAFIAYHSQCTRNDTAPTKLAVAASIGPLVDFANQIGLENVDVVQVVPPGSNPHTFELTPLMMKKISEARVLILNGIGLEFWADAVVDNQKNKEFLAITTAEGLPVLQDEHHSGGNPHIWLNPVNAIAQVEKIREAFIQSDPSHANYYRENAEKYIAQLWELDREIATEVATWKQKKFVTYHPAWDYFAKRYGLEQAEVIEEHPGLELGPTEMARIVEAIKAMSAKGIFVDAQFPNRISEAIAKESNVQIIILDPLGSSETRTSYIAMMRYNVSQMAVVLRE